MKKSVVKEKRLCENSFPFIHFTYKQGCQNLKTYDVSVFACHTITYIFQYFESQNETCKKGMLLKAGNSIYPKQGLFFNNRKYTCKYP